MYTIEFNDNAFEDLAYLRKAEQILIAKPIKQTLSVEPLLSTKNRKQLRPNNLAESELRISRYRAFYNVDATNKVVQIKAVGWKDQNRLFIRG